MFVDVQAKPVDGGVVHRIGGRMKLFFAVLFCCIISWNACAADDVVFDADMPVVLSYEHIKNSDFFVANPDALGCFVLYLGWLNSAWGGQYYDAVTNGIRISMNQLAALANAAVIGIGYGMMPYDSGEYVAAYVSGSHKVSGYDASCAALKKLVPDDNEAQRRLAIDIVWDIFDSVQVSQNSATSANEKGK